MLSCLLKEAVKRELMRAYSAVAVGEGVCIRHSSSPSTRLSRSCPRCGHTHDTDPRARFHPPARAGYRRPPRLHLCALSPGGSLVDARPSIEIANIRFLKPCIYLEYQPVHFKRESSNNTRVHMACPWDGNAPQGRYQTPQRLT